MTNPLLGEQLYIGANSIIECLSVKHQDDVFITECCTGFVGDNGTRRMDAWALKRSYTTELSTAYEVKVTRQDFLSDDKLHMYMNYCNEFYLAVLPNVIQDKSEVPEGAGIMVVMKYKDGYRLRTVRKATYRSVEIPSSFWKAMIVNKACDLGVKDRFAQNRYHATSAKEWIEGKGEYLEVGKKVAKAMSEWKKTDKTHVSLNDNLLRIYHILERFMSLPYDPYDITDDNIKKISDYVEKRLSVEDITDKIDLLNTYLRRFNENYGK